MPRRASVLRYVAFTCAAAVVHTRMGYLVGVCGSTPVSSIPTTSTHGVPSTCGTYIARYYTIFDKTTCEYSYLHGRIKEEEPTHEPHVGGTPLRSVKISYEY